MAKKKQKKAKAAAKRSSRKVVKLATARKAKSKSNGKPNGLPRPSTKPYGQDGQALTGVRILDFTHVQSGPTCTQLLGYMGADVIKVERPGVGDITRTQLRDVKGEDSLYFTMLNGNKRSITIDSKHPQGMRVLNASSRPATCWSENFAPGALDRMGLTWEHIHKTNPRMIVASVKGFGPGPYEDCKVYENVAQCAGGSASTTGFREGPPLVTGAQIGDSGTGLHLAWGIVCALYQRMRTGRGQKVLCAMQDGVLNLARVKLRDQQRLKHGPLTEYSQYGENIPFGEAVPRAGNDSGGGQPGWILKCKGWETDPDAYIYFITQAPVWGGDLRSDRQAGMEDRSRTTPRRRRVCRGSSRFSRRIEAMDHDQNQVRGHGHLQQGRHSGRADPVDEGDRRGASRCARPARWSRSIIPTRGKYLTVGNPVKMSDSITEVKRSPLLGEHTDEILQDVLGFNAERDRGDQELRRAQCAEERRKGGVASCPGWSRAIRLSGLPLSDQD